MRLGEEVVGVDAVMTDQSQKRGAVALPVMLAEGGGRIMIERQMTLDVGRHGPIDVRKYMRRRVVKRVVEIENPDRRTPRTQRFAAIRH